MDELARNDFLLMTRRISADTYTEEHTSFHFLYPTGFVLDVGAMVPSLFDYHMCMWTGDKAKITSDLLKLVHSRITLDMIDIGLQFVIDGEGCCSQGFVAYAVQLCRDLCNVYAPCPCGGCI